jgi:hypothetical protein
MVRMMVPSPGGRRDQSIPCSNALVPRGPIFAVGLLPGHQQSCGLWLRQHRGLVILNTADGA